MLPIYLAIKFIRYQRATVTEHYPINRFRLIFIITMLLLLCGGLQSAFACLLPESQGQRFSIRVDSCHLVISQQEGSSCCQAEVCHQSTLPQRDLGTPGYQTLHQGSHALTHESRPLTPQLKTGEPFIIQHVATAHFSPFLRGSQEPLQSLYSLRTVVLLN
ncbi:MAG: hypothetical protein V2I50_12865 [Desulfuromusa sp.]|jgi:hypothetical protein|nr:hypothetical protein [Desulfuromusa sp.]